MVDIDLTKIPDDVLDEAIRIKEEQENDKE